MVESLIPFVADPHWFLQQNLPINGLRTVSHRSANERLPPQSGVLCSNVFDNYFLHRATKLDIHFFVVYTLPTLYSVWGTGL